MFLIGEPKSILNFQFSCYDLCKGSIFPLIHKTFLTTISPQKSTNLYLTDYQFIVYENLFYYAHNKFIKFFW